MVGPTLFVWLVLYMKLGRILRQFDQDGRRKEVDQAAAVRSDIAAIRHELTRIGAALDVVRTSRS
jgi:hypothetical protein